MRLIDAVKFDISFSFIYSARPGTPAANLVDDTPYDVKLARLQRLQSEIGDYAKSVAQNMIGTTEKVLVEGLSIKDPSELFGRTDNNRIVNFKAPTGSRSRLIGQMVDIDITHSFTNSLRGDVAMSDEAIAKLQPMPYSQFFSIPIKSMGVNA